MSEQNTTSRRKFLQTTTVIGGGLVIGFHLPAVAKQIRNIGVQSPKILLPMHLSVLAKTISLPLLLITLKWDREPILPYR